MDCTFLNSVAIKAEVTRLQQCLFLVTQSVCTPRWRSPSTVFKHPKCQFEIFPSLCPWLNLYFSGWKTVKSIFRFSSAEPPGADARFSFSPPSTLSLKLRSQVHFLILNLPCRHVPFKSVYNRAVGRCYELHCDKALCKPSLSVWPSVCLSVSGLSLPMFSFVLVFSPHPIQYTAFPS